MGETLGGEKTEWLRAELPWFKFLLMLHQFGQVTFAKLLKLSVFPFPAL